jgi:FG-GAP-like repeat
VGGSYGDRKWPTRNAAVGDLNGDGYPDIAVANREMTSYVCYNDGKLHFKCSPLRDTPSAASIVIADIDGDGLNDVIFACRDDCQSRVFFNRNLAGEGQPWGPAKVSIRAIAVTDLNGDGHADIAACPKRLGCFVYFNDGKGNFGAGMQFQKADALEVAGKNEERMPYSMIAADLNGDARPDLIVGYVDGPGVVYYNDGTGRKFDAHPFGDGKGAIYGMASGDLDGDGRLDLVAARSDAPSFILFNRGVK